MVNWINVRYLSAIESIHEFPIRSIDFVIDFTQADIDVNVFMELPLWMVFDGNRIMGTKVK